jgi:hypothetical protein
MFSCETVSCTIYVTFWWVIQQLLVICSLARFVGYMQFDAPQNLTGLRHASQVVGVRCLIVCVIMAIVFSRSREVAVVLFRTEPAGKQF